MTDFATYLDRTERDQLDARAATAEHERDEARADRDGCVATIADVWIALTAAGLASTTTSPAVQVRDLAAQRDAARAENARLDRIRADLQRELDGLKADNASLRRANSVLVAENCRRRGELAAAQELIAEIRTNRERDDRALAAYDTASPPPAAPLTGPVDQDAVDVLAEALAGAQAEG